MTQRIVAVLSNLHHLVRAVEAILIDLIAASAPWLAPILPAYMIHAGLQSVLAMPSWVAWIGAAVVEFLGMSAVSTTLMLWEYNDRRREAAGKTLKRRRKRVLRGLAPVWVAGGAGAFYLVVVLVVNVLLDTAGPVERIAKALLSSLSIIAGLILAVRSQHARRLEDAEARRQEMRQLRKERGNLPKPSGILPTLETLPKPTTLLPDDWRQLSVDQKHLVAEKTTAEIAALAGISERAARGWKAKARANGMGKNALY